LFLFSGGALLLFASSVLEGHALPLFISALHAAFLVMAVAFVGPRLLQALRRPVPLMACICLVVVCVASLLGTR
jgi:purine-cytosine permease-like protein